MAKKISKAPSRTSAAKKLPVSARPPHSKQPSTPSAPAWKVRVITLLRKKQVFIPLYILVGLAITYLLVLPFFPQVQAEAQQITRQNPGLARVAPKSFKPPDTALPADGNWLIIPKADIVMPIVEGDSIDVLNDAVGVWHQTGAFTDNYSLAGHRLQYNRTVNQSLYNLDKMQAGDTGVYVVLDGKPQQYRVREMKVVPPTSVEILDPTGRQQLTIYTCNDFFNQRRLVLVADPISGQQPAMEP